MKTPIGNNRKPECGNIAGGKNRFIQAVDALPPRYKTIIILQYFENLKISEIAFALDIPEGSVKAYSHRAKEKLRQYLKEDYLYV